MTKVARAEPAIAEGFGIGLGIIVVAGENGGTDYTNFAGFTCANLLASIVLDLHFHAGAVEAAGADARFRTVLGVMKRRRQHGDVTGDFTQAEILDQHRAELCKRALLVRAIHRRAGIDDIAQ